MVSDTSTDSLIHWSESGDSFFVPNHEQFGKELLPRFFKHSNFSSFVRQLNMYGFHKVPHLQAGVLKNDAPSELWEFVNPFFKRNQQHLLSRVTRKNNRPNQPPAPTTGSTGPRASARQAAANATPSGPQVQLITDGTIEGEAGQLVGPTGQVFDLNAIASNMAALRQTQSSIREDLKRLQTSNELLWKEAYDAREKHRTHEETMNLIVSFLERLFGTEGEGLKGLKEALRRAGMGGVGRGRQMSDENQEEGAVVAKKRKRLGLDRMIGDGTEGLDSDTEGRIQEIRNDPYNFSIPRLNRVRSKPNMQKEGSSSSEPWSSSSQRFVNLPTDEDSTSVSGSTTRAIPTPIPDQSQSQQQGKVSEQSSNQATLSPLSDGGGQNNPGNAIAPFNYPSSMPQNPHPSQQNQPYFNINYDTGSTPAPMSPRSAAATAQTFNNLDPALLQTTIGSLLQSPAAASMFLNSLNNSVQAQSLTSPTKVGQHQPGSYPFPSHFGLNANGHSNSGLGNATGYNSNAGNNFNNNSNVGLNGVNGVDDTDYSNFDPTLALFSPLPNRDSLLNNNAELLNAYEKADQMGNNVATLQETFDSLVRSMGLEVPDPNVVSGQNGVGNMNGPVGGVGNTDGLDLGNYQFDNDQNANGNVNGMMDGSNELGDLGPDFNMDDFLSELAKGDELGGGNHELDDQDVVSKS